jgi:Raf kinase inhibitor-like YbhB/YbcL family protein
MPRLSVALVAPVMIAVVTCAAVASAMTVDSSAFWNGGAIPPIDSASIDGCRGRNISPPLRISGLPENVRSLGVVMDDPDADGGAGYVHWVAYGISPRMTTLPSGFGSAPGAYVGGRNDAGTALYSGPCPPPGDPPHHYRFSVYALTLPPARLAPGLTRAAFLQAIAGKSLAVATLSGTFGR